MSLRLSLRQLYDRHPDGFVVSAYQRHYVWGQHRDMDKDAAKYLTSCLLESYDKGRPYFLQGITVKGDSLVDGQQRLTYLYLAFRHLGYAKVPKLRYENREEAQNWLQHIDEKDISENVEEEYQDIYYFKHTIRCLSDAIDKAAIDREALISYLLDAVEVLYIEIPAATEETAIYRMMNGAKAPMEPSDIIKADIMRRASDPRQPQYEMMDIDSLRGRYATEWEEWTRWWHLSQVRTYYSTLSPKGIDLLIKLCIREIDASYDTPLTYDEFRMHLISYGIERYHAAKRIFGKLRNVQRRFEDAYTDPTTYNRIRAIMLLQNRQQCYRFLYHYFVESAIDEDELIRYYKLSFLGMSIDEIANHEPDAERFDDLIASLSMADVYHSETKRDVFNLLLRLNIDEDIKLGRKFDFSVWENRSLEHIYSKSKVWHTDNEGHIYDGNDNLLPTTLKDIQSDPTFMPRAKIVNYDGIQLSEHCLGNLVLLYGANNATFGNVGFGQKKTMFLTPGDMTVFESRNLLHTVCVFAGNTWDHKSIVDNYNLTLKNLKIYYGYK